MNFDQLNLIPPCLRGEEGIRASRLDVVLLGSVSYYIELLIFIIGVLAFFYLIYGGIQMATGLGNEAKYTQAKNIISHAVIGIIIATLSLTIVSFAMNLFNVPGPRLFGEQAIEQCEDDEGTGVNNGSNQNQNEPTEHNPTDVTPLAASRRIERDPNPSTVTPEELAFVRQHGNTTVNPRGERVMILVHDHDPFRAYLYRPGRSRQSLTVIPVRNNQGEVTDYVVKSWGPLADYQGAQILLEQEGNRRILRINTGS